MDEITTLAELEALPVGSVIVDTEGVAGLVDLADQRDRLQAQVADYERESHAEAMHADGAECPVCNHLTIEQVVAENEVLLDRLAAHDRKVAARALREAADDWQVGGWAKELPTGNSRPALILGMAQAGLDWLRARADQIERGVPDE